MALYSVERTDTVKPGEFTNALVIAFGHLQAIRAVEHLLPAGAVVDARAIEVRKTHASVTLLASYFDEREPLTQDEYAGDVSRPGDFNW